MSELERLREMRRAVVRLAGELRTFARHRSEIETAQRLEEIAASPVATEVAS